MKPGRGSSAAIVSLSERVRAAPWLAGNPEWEAVKGSRRSLSPSDAVEECETLRTQYREMWCEMPFKVNLDKILLALASKKIPFVLTGAHGIAVWTGRPRATKDVDILVKPGRNYVRAVAAIKDLYPELVVRRFAGVSAFFFLGERESVIDVTFLMRADNEVTLKSAIGFRKGKKRYRIPRLEAALANKYGAMLSLGKDPFKRQQDALDFALMAKHSTDEGQQPINLKKLAALAETIWPGGGGKEILRLVNEAMAGKVPNLE